MQEEKSLAPISAAERIQAVDVLRGFALFGILLVNMTSFSWPVQAVITQFAEWDGLLDLWWLARFCFGPMEWLWRSLTYLKWQPMRLKT